MKNHIPKSEPEILALYKECYRIAKIPTKKLLYFEYFDVPECLSDLAAMAYAELREAGCDDAKANSVVEKVFEKYNPTWKVAELFILMHHGLFEEATEYLEDNPQLIQSENEWGCSPLSVAAAHNNVNLLKTCLRLGGDINQQGCDGDTPLVNAAERNCIEAIKVLIENGADLNIMNGYGQTALCVAINNSKWEVVRLLIASGATLVSKNISGNELMVLPDDARERVDEVVESIKQRKKIYNSVKIN